MFDFLKNLFGNKTECTDCDGHENDINGPTFQAQVSEVQPTVESTPEVIAQHTVESTPEVIAQPTLNMSKNTEEVTETTEVVEPMVETPLVVETTEVVTPTEEETPSV